MKSLALIVTAACLLLLGGCATTIRSDVTTFHQWPSGLPDKHYAFALPPGQEDTLEYQSYRQLVATELGRLGFQPASPTAPASLQVGMRFSTIDQPVRVVHVSDPPFYSSSRFGYMRPFRGYWGWYGRYAPFYDPFWYGPPEYYSSIEHVYRRDLHISISALADGKRLYDVTVHNQSRKMSTPMMMPAMVKSAFTDFPGPSGVARQVEFKQE